MLHDKGFITEFNTGAEVKTYLGSSFVESRLFVLRQERDGVVKFRVLLDCNR